MFPFESMADFACNVSNESIEPRFSKVSPLSRTLVYGLLTAPNSFADSVRTDPRGQGEPGGKAGENGAGRPANRRDGLRACPPRHRFPPRVSAAPVPCYVCVCCCLCGYRISAVRWTLQEQGCCEWKAVPGTENDVKPCPRCIEFGRLLLL